MTRKKTTLNVDPELWRELKIAAAVKNETITDLLHEIVRKEVKRTLGDTSKIK